MMIVIMMAIKYRSQFGKQKQCFFKNASLKAELTKNEYNRIYGKIDFDYEKVDLKWIHDQDDNMVQTNSNYEKIQLIADNR